MWSSSSSSFVRPFFFAANSMHIYAGVPISFYKHTLSLSQTIIFPLAAIRFILLFPYWVSVCVCVCFISFCCSYRSIDPSAPNLYFLSMMTTSAIVFLKSNAGSVRIIFYPFSPPPPPPPYRGPSKIFTSSSSSLTRRENFLWIESPNTTDFPPNNSQHSPLLSDARVTSCCNATSNNKNNNLFFSPFVSFHGPLAGAEWKYVLSSCVSPHQLTVHNTCNHFKSA